MVKLKKNQEAFTVVDGPDAGRTFERGVEYDHVPKGYESRFEKVRLGISAEPKIIDGKRSK